MNARHASSDLLDECRRADPLGMLVSSGVRSRLRPRADRTLRLLLGTSWIAGRVGVEARGRDARPRYGRFFDRHPRLPRALALVALAWGVGYLTWRVGWSGEGANPIAFAMLLVTEVYGLWALGMLTWFSWWRRPVTRPPTTAGRRSTSTSAPTTSRSRWCSATLAGCRALTYPHTTYLLDDGRRAGDARAGRAGRRRAT